ncbi:MAG TPA: hypothetical protein VMV87_14505, partial [Burkholderiales bacterium]|nr:hypothetical protein [Burkholderiales bacterium]
MEAKSLKLKLHGERKGGREDEIRLRVLPGKILVESQGKQAANSRALTKLFRAVARIACPNRGNRPMYGGGVRRAKLQSRAQCCIVKVARNARSGAKAVDWKEHGNYLDSRGKRDAFNERGSVTRAGDVLQRWHDERDANHFSIAISPQRECSEPELRQLAHDTAERMGRDLGIPLEWLAVVHMKDKNHKQPHLHLVVRGRDRLGKAIRLDPEYMNRTLEDSVRQELTQRVGERSERELDQERRYRATSEYKAFAAEKKAATKGKRRAEFRDIVNDITVRHNPALNKARARVGLEMEEV